MRLSVCLSVRTLTGKRLELSAPNLVHVYCIAVARHALTQRSKSERSRSYGYENRHGPTVASDHDRHSVHPNAAVLPAVNRSRRILTRKRALWVSYGTPDLALIGERGSVQEPQNSKFAQDCGFRPPEADTMDTDEIWRVSADVWSASAHQI